MATLGEFGRRMRTVRARQVREGRLKVKRVAAAKIINNVVNSTPEDTGRAKANWNVGFNRPNHFVTDPFYTETRLGWQSKLSTSMLAISRVGSNDSIYISNALPYIGFLNRGGSQQAPRDFVLISAAAAARSLRDIKFFR